MNRIDKVFSKGKAFIPFSDPVAEGVVIEAADNRALSSGTTIDKILDMVKRIREGCDAPIAFMTYVNPVFSYGSERFLHKCKEAGVDAIIVPSDGVIFGSAIVRIIEQYGRDCIAPVMEYVGIMLTAIKK